MFANINEIFSYVNLLLNKQGSGSINGTQFSLAINAAQQEYLRIKIGLPETFTTEKREAPQAFQAAQVISDAVRPFIVPATLTKSGQGFNLPSNFAAWGNNDYLYVVLNDGQNIATRQPIEFVTLGERAIRLNNYIKYPTVEYPIATYLNNQIKIEPDDIENVNLIYVRYPVTPVWGFTVDANDNEIYDPTTSVQLEFGNIEWQNIAHLAVKYISIYLREEFMYQASAEMIDKGK